MLALPRRIREKGAEQDGAPYSCWVARRGDPFRLLRRWQRAHRFEPASGAAAAPVSAGSGTVTPTPITLQGVPSSSATVGGHYVYQPTVSASSGVVTFAIEGQPAWATFDASTGVLSGTPSTGDVGLTGDITIIASNGTNTGSVGPFIIRVNPAAPGSSNAPPVISGTPGVQRGWRGAELHVSAPGERRSQRAP